MTEINKILKDKHFKIILHSIFNIICIMLLLMLVLILCIYILGCIIKYISNNININIITKEQFASCVCAVKGSGNVNVDLPSVNAEAPQLPKQPELIPLPKKPDTPEVPLPNYPQADKPDTPDTPSVACDPVSMVLNSVFIW